MIAKKKPHKALNPEPLTWPGAQGAHFADPGHYFPFGPRGSTVSGRQLYAKIEVLTPDFLTGSRPASGCQRRGTAPRHQSSRPTCPVPEPRRTGTLVASRRALDN